MAVWQTSIKTLVVFVTVLLLNSLAVSAMLESKEVPRMTIAELKSHLDDANFTIIDVRSDADWQDSTMKIKGAIREEPQQVSSWIGKYFKDKNIVLYCAWLHEATSSGVGLQLMEKGFSRIYVLEGGWNAWERAGYPVEPKDKRTDTAKFIE